MKGFFKYMFFLLLCLIFVKHSSSQTINPALNKGPWKAEWVTVPDESTRDYGVYHFRKNIRLDVKPASFIVHVSADNRYKLYVNQMLVSLGPARGDTYYWNYETVDLAPYLRAGKNIIAALVWNDGDYRPEMQMSIRTAFIMQGNGSKEDVIINTGSSWKCARDSAYKPTVGIGYSTYYVAGPGEFVNMNSYLSGWESVDYDDSKWKKTIKIDNGNPKGTVNAVDWMLVPSAIPQMELKQQRILALRRTEGIKIPASFPGVKTAVTIPANTTITLLLDQTFLTNAYITLNLSKGKNASLSLSYAEALFTKLNGSEGMVKGNRNDIAGQIFSGRRDSIIANGKLNQSFTTLAFRTYRYIQLKVATGNDPLVIDDIYGTFTGYPFKLNAKLQSGNKELRQILDIGWRTARLCAGETYFDCPYYEQLQYVGDTRIQALISYYNSGDDRLVRNALNLMDHSRIAEGVTLSRHPSFSPQIITTFSLWYVGMLHDYWMYRPDSAFVKSKLQGVRDVLTFFKKYQQADGSVHDTPYWTFADWVTSKGWDFGQPPKSANGTSALLDMQLMWAYQQAAEMETNMGTPDMANLYQIEAARLKATIQKKYWDEGRQLYSDTEDKELFSQHVNSLAILAGMVSSNDMTQISKKMESDSSLTQCTIYFKYYLHQALVKGGLGNDYLKWIDIWRKNMEMGLTTWAEISDLEHVRSDCHAWGSSPNIEFYRTILGIDSYAPGFSKIKIEPHLADITEISGEIPHPNGAVSCNYKLEKGKWNVVINLPENTSGTFIWKGRNYVLKAGENSFRI